MRPVFPVRLTLYYETFVFLHVFTHAKTIPADIFFKLSSQGYDVLNADHAIFYNYNFQIQHH
jgi:hypothetical protein